MGPMYPISIETTRCVTHRRTQMANKSFRRGQSTYTCRCCGRVTRDTNSEGSIELCAQCYELAGLENELSDYGVHESLTQSATMYFEQLIAKGITRDKLASAFGELYATCYPAVPAAAKTSTTKYDYPTGLTNAQKKAFRAKARRAK